MRSRRAGGGREYLEGFCVVCVYNIFALYVSVSVKKKLRLVLLHCCVVPSQCGKECGPGRAVRARGLTSLVDAALPRVGRECKQDAAQYKKMTTAADSLSHAPLSHTDCGGGVLVHTDTRACARPCFCLSAVRPRRTPKSAVVPCHADLRSFVYCFDSAATTQGRNWMAKSDQIGEKPATKPGIKCMLATASSCLTVPTLSCNIGNATYISVLRCVTH